MGKSLAGRLPGENILERVATPQCGGRWLRRIENHPAVADHPAQPLPLLTQGALQGLDDGICLKPYLLGGSIHP